MDIKERINELKEQINYHNKKYYVEDDPKITDYEYDMLINELKELENNNPQYITEDSPTQRVGGEPLAKFKKVVHEVQMQSLSDVFSYDELDSFDNRIKQAAGNEYEYVVEKKIDGLSVSLEYINGKFTRGSTRGNGFVGEDVTLNLKTIKTLPLLLKDSIPFLEVRGEVFISKKNFAKINEEQEANGQQPFANPRNAAAGSIRQLDPKIAAKRRLDIFVFNIQRITGKEFKTHSESLEYLKKIGFTASPDFKVCKNINEAKEYIKKIDENRKKYSYDTDGAVVKLNDLMLRTKIGETSKAPKWAVAFKFPAEQKETKIKDIYVQVGRTGVLTPNAVFEPVNIAGSTVSRATLHNLDNIRDKDIKINDTVLIQKAGDIIPEVVRVIKGKRTGGEKNFIMPDKCPACGSDVIRHEGEAAYRCVGIECPAQLYRSIVHFASRDAMNIEGLGPSVIKMLLENGFIKDIAGLYRLYEHKDKLIEIERMGEKSVENLLNSIENSKKNDIARLIFGFGIRHIGQRAAKLLAEEFGSIENIINADALKIESINEFGGIMAQSVVEFFAHPQTIDTLKKLKEIGVNMQSEKSNEKGDKPFDNLTFVLTGTLSSYSRKEVSDIIERKGGRTSSSVSKNTDYVLAGEKAGSKFDKARELQVKIIGEEEFKGMLKDKGIGS